MTFPTETHSYHCMAHLHVLACQTSDSLVRDHCFSWACASRCFRCLIGNYFRNISQLFIPHVCFHRMHARIHSSGRVRNKYKYTIVAAARFDAGFHIARSPVDSVFPCYMAVERIFILTFFLLLAVPLDLKQLRLHFVDEVSDISHTGKMIES